MLWYVFFPLFNQCLWPFFLNSFICLFCVYTMMIDGLVDWLWMIILLYNYERKLISDFINKKNGLNWFHLLLVFFSKTKENDVLSMGHHRLALIFEVKVSKQKSGKLDSWNIWVNQNKQWLCVWDLFPKWFELSKRSIFVFKSMLTEKKIQIIIIFLTKLEQEKKSFFSPFFSSKWKNDCY